MHHRRDRARGRFVPEVGVGGKEIGGGRWVGLGEGWWRVRKQVGERTGGGGGGVSNTWNTRTRSAAASPTHAPLAQFATYCFVLAKLLRTLCPQPGCPSPFVGKRFGLTPGCNALIMRLKTTEAKACLPVVVERVRRPPTPWTSMRHLGAFRCLLQLGNGSASACAGVG